MWVARRLQRTRPPRSPASTAVRESAATPPAVPAPSDLAVSLIRAELDRLLEALSRTTAANTPRPHSPALLAGALTTAIAAACGTGCPTVTRSPAGLYTPEYWHIAIEDADEATRELMRRLTSDGRTG